jgi:predicted PurR-regulated permease PerM
LTTADGGELPKPSQIPTRDVPTKRKSTLLVLLFWLLALALLYTLYFAKSLLMPLVVALLFALLLSPLVAVMKRLYIPRTLSAIVIICAIGGPFTLLAIELAEPAHKWAKQLPELSERLTDELDDLTGTSNKPVRQQAVAEPEESGGFTFFGLFDKKEVRTSAPPPVQAPKDDGESVGERVKQGGMELMVTILAATPVVIAQLLTCVILILFLLIFGPRLFNAYIHIFVTPDVREQRVELVGSIQHELSRYIVTVSVINACLGLTTGLALWLVGVEDALLWGVLVGLLNFAPYVGPIFGMAMLCLAGLAQYGPVLLAALPVLVYFSINMIEAQFVTPLVLGRNMRLNPLILIVWLFIWGWLWGAVGVLIAVPLLVCIKLAVSKMQVSDQWVRLIETRA